VHAVLVVDQQLLLSGVLLVRDHLVDVRRTEVLAGVSVLLGADVPAEVGVGHDQMGRLVHLVRGSGELHERLAIERELAVELEILKILWDEQPCSVRTVHNLLSQHKKTNYSTTVKMMSVMLQKGIVKRNEKVTPHLYRAAMTKKRAAKTFVGELVEKMYDGSAMSLVLQALSGGQASQQEIDEARKLLDEMESKQKRSES